MGASSSTEQVSSEQREAETLAASTGALPMLQKSFSKLSNPETKAIPLKSLQECFSIAFNNVMCESPHAPDYFLQLLDHLGPSIADVFFASEKGGIGWVEFLRGYTKCCGRMSALMSLSALMRVFSVMTVKVGIPSKLQFESDDADCKISGSLQPNELLVLLWMCWIMTWSSRMSKFPNEKLNLDLPDINNLVLSAVVSCAEVGSDLNIWDCDITRLELQLPAGKIHTWALNTVPNLSDCFVQFVNARLQKAATSESEMEASSSSISDVSSTKSCDTHLLTCGRAWAISLSLRSTIGQEILRVCFPSNEEGSEESLLYRSSIHGKGLNRFWSNVEGYHGPMLMLIASSGNSEGSTNSRRWIIGALTQQGFENKDFFYGSSGNLYAISPVFHSFSHSGKEKNFVYSHLHPTGRVYEAHPKPVGIAFGGTLGNERIFVDEDFSRVTIRHHAVDKTYQHGSLIPDQGFLPVEAHILDVEVWGLGGRTAREVQLSYQKREQLFTEQRRKVDLKTFASWDDSPEKMMMDMMADPNRVTREDR